MKTRGITRHFDKEGRIVIPKEYKKMLKLKDEEVMEIFVGEDNTIILKKHVQEGVKGDLISRSALINEIRGRCPGSQDVDFIVRLIVEMPTAYNVDKVLEQINEEKGHLGFEQMRIDKAIELVKAGGVNE